MVYVVLGCMAYVFFVLYDYACIYKKHKFFKLYFAAGVCLLLISTAALSVRSFSQTESPALRIAILLIIALIFLGLLVYTLFFAIPFSATYVSGESKLCTEGVYALCRHPGVLWLAGFYLCLWLAFNTYELLAAFAAFTVLDVLYVVLQDRWTFIKMFPDYQRYKEKTPFIIPTWTSIRKCIHTLSAGKDSREIPR